MTKNDLIQTTARTLFEFALGDSFDAVRAPLDNRARKNQATPESSRRIYHAFVLDVADAYGRLWNYPADGRDCFDARTFTAVCQLLARHARSFD